MANSNGGVIVYGLKEKEISKGHSVPEDVSPIPTLEMTKDQLSQLLSSNIQPVIDGIEISYIPYDEESGFTLYLFLKVIQLTKTNYLICIINGEMLLLMQWRTMKLGM